MAAEIGSHYSLLDDLDMRQDDVLEQLDQLNQRIELLLNEFTTTVHAPLPASVPAE
jgi:hypothetical protein